jgi:hypothetical protein
MGSMSASDAAPLPRLGEVYFDVRGESRSMRLSWYADTGVAVFSIWQGGTCTGTFRLPIADLPRMIKALQRGPHDDDAGAAAPLDGPRGAAEPHGRPVPQSRTGQQGTTGHEPGHGAGHGPGEYAPMDYRSGDYDPAGEYRHTGAQGRYEETRAAYAGDSLPGDPGGYGAERGGGYEDEPTGVYHGDLLGEDYRNEPAAGYRDGGHRDDRRGPEPENGPPAGGYRNDPAAGGYRGGPRGGEPDDEPAGRYQEDPLGGHADDPHTGSYREDPLGGGYRGGPRGGEPDDEPAGRYREDPLGGGYRGGPRGGEPYDHLTSRYRDDPLGGHADDRRARSYHEDPPGGGYGDGPPTGDYAGDPLTGPYPGDRGAGGHPEDRGGGYPAARHSADPLTGDYPTGPADSAIDGGDYPDASGNAGYSPARPYVAPVPGGPAGRRRGRGRPADREESDPSPDSFPYGRAPEEPEVPRRGR